METGVTYRISGLRKVDAAHSGDGQPSLFVRNEDWGAVEGFDVDSILPDVKAKGEWEPFELFYTPSETGVFRMIFAFTTGVPRKVPSTIDGAAYFDDISMRAVTP